MYFGKQFRNIFLYYPIIISSQTPKKNKNKNTFAISYRLGTFAT